ncbi:ABC transporter ATP-binding protein [Rheinheimera muenzenbergensis]|uniref:ABC transporter ATP-binding protein n=1 Tax=Rheinheimera muenzenbergensis TaxID=1193628 RepID=A0ABU8C3T1_9GAMM
MNRLLPATPLPTTSNNGDTAAPFRHRGAATGALQALDINKHFDIRGQRLQVLHNVSLTVQAGEFVSIVGPSGCGKSTLLRLILGLDQPDSGSLRLDGTTISGTGLERGIVFQDHRLLPWMTVAQNINLAMTNSKLSSTERATRVAHHLALVNLQDFANVYPHQLSGGMAQRAAIARALVNRPQVLLLDEPFGALDALTRIKLQTELQHIWLTQRSTVVMVTHDVEEAVYLSDRVVVMQANPGKIARVVTVPQPHPRKRRDTTLRDITDDILQDLLSKGSH